MPENADIAPHVRIFVGIKIAPNIARELARFAIRLAGPSVRLVAPDDIHLTLVPPWNEASVPDAVERLRLVTSRFYAFLLTFRHLGFGPRPRRPRLLWADCAATDEITALHQALLQAYGQSDLRLFRPHVTLARIGGNETAIARKHPIDQDLSLTQRVETIELFRSPSPRGARVSDTRFLATRQHFRIGIKSVALTRWQRLRRPLYSTLGLP